MSEERRQRVVAVVVTFNRRELLKRTIGQLRKQTHRLEAIIVVNNGSTDGTGEWLASEDGLVVLTQENVGGSGGFCTGIERAMQMENDWVWCMDDDVFPEENCLEELLKAHAEHHDASILTPRLVMGEKIVYREFTDWNLTNPFKSMGRGPIAKMEITKPVYIACTSFEGPLFRREVIERIGLPRKELFIFRDDMDYSYRAWREGFYGLYVPQAVMAKENFFTKTSWTERQQKKKWKRYYSVRNATFFDHHYGKNWGVRYVRGFIGMAGYVLTALVTMPFSKAWRMKDIGMLWQAYSDGIHERLGKRDFR